MREHSEITETSHLNDLLSDEAINSPFTYYKRLRDTNPVYWNERWKGWIVTGYDAVVAGYRDSERLSSDRFSGPFGVELRKSATNYEQLMRFLSSFFGFKDAPFHTEIRMLVNAAFTPKSVEAFRPRTREIVEELTDGLRGREECDFISDFAFTLPVLVLSEFLGIPPEARFDVRRWSGSLASVIFVSGNDTDRLKNGENAMRNLVSYLRPIIQDRVANPQDDFLSRLVHLKNRKGKGLDDDTIIASAAVMVFAGHETTMNLLANGIITFDRFPDQWQRLREDPSLAKTAVEEVLRHDGPIRGVGRWAKEPFELFGQQIKEGDRLLLVQHAANRDPTVFEDPEGFDIGRWPNRHVAFGQGPHMCLGAPLARVEGQEAFTHLAKTFPRIRVLNKELNYNPTFVSRSVTGLRVKCEVGDGA